MPQSVWDRIEEARARHDVLQHPFYVRWSAGELTSDELARYSGQYRHAVTAIAELSTQAAAELPDHPELGVARRRGVRARCALGRVRRRRRRRQRGAGPTTETKRCVEVWTTKDGALRALARLYAIESGQPEIAKTKLEGLAAHYGVDSEVGTRYFTVHRGRDVEHAAEGRELLEELIASPADEDAVVAAAEDAFAANWRLLDGV